MKRCSNMLPDSALQSVRSATIDRNMTSRSLPWNSRASPHSKRRRSSSAASQRERTSESMQRACCGPSSDTTPRLRPAKRGSASSASISAAMASASARFSSRALRCPPGTWMSTSGGSIRSDAFGMRSGWMNF